jgi:uncharacterized membrane protein
LKKFLKIALTALLSLPLFSNTVLAAANIVYESNHVIFQPINENTIKITSMATLVNSGDDKFEGKVGYGLPLNYSNLQIGDQSIKPTNEANAFTIDATIAPNEKKSISYSNDQGLTNNVAKIDFVYPHDVQVLNILIPKDTAEVTITGAKFEDKGEFPFESTTLKQYEIKDLKANTKVTIDYKRNPNAPAQTGTEGTQNNQNQETDQSNVTRKAPQFHNPGHLRMWNQSALSSFDPHILLIVLGIILVAIVVYFAYFEMKRRKQLEHVKSDQEERVFKQLIAKRSAIMNKILELEEEYNSGNISDEDYTKKMEAYKNHLIQVKLSLRDFVE